MRVLVTYGSKRGGTAGIAHMLASTLLDQGLEVDVRPAAEVDSPEDYDAVVVGGAVYFRRWHRDARRFVERHAALLGTMPVWLFSSGPLDDSASSGDLPAVPQVRQLLERIHAQGHITFGGRLQPDAPGALAHWMARTRTGDWRDPRLIRAWGEGIGEALHLLEQAFPPSANSEPSAPSMP